jgi:hypothetical protein
MNQEQYQQWHITRWVLLVVSSAQRERATDLIIAPANEGGTSVRHKVDSTWQNWAPTPGLDWPLVLSELGGLAGIRDAPYPKEGIIYVAYSGVRVRWQIRMTSENTGCTLHDLGRDMI